MPEPNAHSHDGARGRVGFGTKVIGVISVLAIIATLIADGSTGFGLVRSLSSHIPAVDRRFEAELIGKLDTYMTYGQVREILQEEPYVHRLKKYVIYQFERDREIIQVVTDRDDVVLSIGLFAKDPELKVAGFRDFEFPFGGSLAAAVEPYFDDSTEKIVDCGAKSAVYLLAFNLDDAAHRFQSFAVGVTSGIPDSKVDDSVPCYILDVGPSCQIADDNSSLSTDEPDASECLTDEQAMAEIKVSTMVVTRPMQPLIPEMLCQPEVVEAGYCPEASWKATD